MPTTFQRQPLAVMFTDIKGYTSLTSKDEILALNLVDKKRSILQPLLKKHKGIFVKEMGDGTVTYFKDPSEATDCAIKLQEQVYDDKNLNIRIGIHYGDTIIKNKDVFGDTVNIASRIESLAVAGGVFISREARDKIKEPHNDVSLGLQTMKGVGRLIEVYGLKGKLLSSPDPKDYKENKIRVHTDKEVPSIAILPFENKGKKEDDFYAHSIISDLITDVTSAGRIRVASKKQIDDAGDLPIDKLAKKLFVRYIATGDLWKMKDKVQLSVELYDTKDSKVVWSDSWQETWANLSVIKAQLSDELLKALDIKPKGEKRLEATNPEAYEFYLKAKYKYSKRKNIEDTEIVRGLIHKAIELNDTLVIAKLLLGWTYYQEGNYDKVMEIYTPTLKQVKELGNKHAMGDCLGLIGLVYRSKGNYDKALDYFERSLKVEEELGDNRGMGASFLNIGIVSYEKGDNEKALDYFKRSLKINENLGNKYGIGDCLGSIGVWYWYNGDYDKPLEYMDRSLKIAEELGDKFLIGQNLGNLGALYKEKGIYDKAMDYLERSLKINEELCHKSMMGSNLNNIGDIYHDKGNYKKAEEYRERSLKIRNRMGARAGILLYNTICLYLTYKSLGKEHDEKEIHRLIKKTKDIGFRHNFYLYKLLEDISYLEAAYIQLQKKVDAMGKGLKVKFLGYPLPKTIVEEYKKLKNN